MPPAGRCLADRRKRRIVRLPFIFVIPLVLLSHPVGSVIQAEAAGPSPTPEPDPLAIPALPDNPSPIDLGRVTYYYHCMPCHGDKGQGLTDEWRGVWVADHQDCWSRGCHGGKSDDLGFPIPRNVPPAMPPFTNLARFGSLEALSAFLYTSHPPQNPGVLDQADCRNLAAYLTQHIPPAPAPLADTTFADTQSSSAGSADVARAAIALALTLGLAWLIGSREPR